MITIDLLKNHSYSIAKFAKIFHVLGGIWLPGMSISEIEASFNKLLNDTIPLAQVALYDGIPVGFCALHANDGIRPDLTPWLGDLVVDPAYQKQGIAKMLVDATKEKAKTLGFKKLYLFTFEFKIVEYYIRLGWHKIAMDEFNGHPVTVMEINL